MSEEGKTLRLVMHCYGYSPELAKEYVKLGAYIGVGGVLTFKNAKKLREAVEYLPLSALVLETDAPYLTPRNVPGLPRTNVPANIRYVAETLASIVSASAVMTGAE